MKRLIVSMLCMVILSTSAALVPPVIENARRAVVVSKFLRAGSDAENIAKIVMDYARVQVVRECGGDEEHVLSFDYDNGLMEKRKWLPWYNVVSPGQYLHSQVIVGMNKDSNVGIIVAKKNDKVCIRAHILKNIPNRRLALVNKEYACKKAGDLCHVVLDKPESESGIQFEHEFFRCDFLSRSSLVTAGIRLVVWARSEEKGAGKCSVQ